MGRDEGGFVARVSGRRIRNYINHASARRIGLLDFPPEQVQPAGNTALLGAKLALFSQHEEESEFKDLRGHIRHVSLHEDPQFHETFVAEMIFPKR